MKKTKSPTKSPKSKPARAAAAPVAEPPPCRDHMLIVGAGPCGKTTLASYLAFGMRVANPRQSVLVVENIMDCSLPGLRLLERANDRLIFVCCSLDEVITLRRWGITWQRSIVLERGYCPNS